VKEFDKVQDSGKREEYDSGMKRDTQEDKPRYDLISIPALRRLATHYTNGAKKYAERNWEKGGPFSRFYASAFRHLIAFAEGKTDEDHLAALAWNAFCLIHFQETGQDKEFNDMFKPVVDTNHNCTTTNSILSSNVSTYTGERTISVKIKDEVRWFRTSLQSGSWYWYENEGATDDPFHGPFNNELTAFNDIKNTLKVIDHVFPVTVTQFIKV
jgi:hypothetical protein